MVLAESSWWASAQICPAANIPIVRRASDYGQSFIEGSFRSYTQTADGNFVLLVDELFPGGTTTCTYKQYSSGSFAWGKCMNMANFNNVVIAPDDSFVMNIHVVGYRYITLNYTDGSYINGYEMSSPGYGFFYERNDSMVFGPGNRLYIASQGALNIAG